MNARKSDVDLRTLQKDIRELVEQMHRMEKSVYGHTSNGSWEPGIVQHVSEIRGFFTKFSRTSRWVVTLLLATVVSTVWNTLHLTVALPWQLISKGM